MARDQEVLHEQEVAAASASVRIAAALWFALRAAVLVLAFAVIAAHVLRWGSAFVAGLLVACPIMALIVRQRWAMRLCQVLLVIAAAEWLRTLWVLYQQRQAAGEPATRMALILGGVAAFTLLAAALAPVPRTESRKV